MIRKNLFYKLLALGVAIGLWAYVNSEQNPHARKTVTIPIEMRNLARGYVSEPSAREASVTVQGLKTVIDGVRKEDISAWVDLHGLPKDKSVAQGVFQVRTRVSGVAADEVNTAVNPKTVRVRVEALSGKRLPVEVKFLSAPPLGYSYGDPQISPASVGVSGKITQVYRVRRIMLPIPAVSGDQDVEGRFSVVPVDSKGNVVTGVTLDAEAVRLKLALVEVPATKAVVVSQNITGQPRPPFKVARVAIVPSSVTLEGRPSALVKASTVSTDPVSIDDASSTVSQDVALHVPSGVRVVGRSKVRVTVYLEHREETREGS